MLATLFVVVLLAVLYWFTLRRWFGRWGTRTHAAHERRCDHPPPHAFSHSGSHCQCAAYELFVLYCWAK